MNALDLIRKMDALHVKAITAMNLPAPGVRVATLTFAPANASVSN